jgi:SAM-dependent methyltransferase
VRLFLADGFEFLKDRHRTYDLITLCDVIEHVPREKVLPLLRLVYVALRPGGALYVRTPNMASLLASYSRYLDFTHLTGFTEFSLTQVLEAAGFACAHLTPDRWERNLSCWRPWAPWRGFGLRGAANRFLHRLLYALRAQHPAPSVLGYNLEVWAHRETCAHSLRTR